MVTNSFLQPCKRIAWRKTNVVYQRENQNRRFNLIVPQVQVVVNGYSTALKNVLALLTTGDANLSGDGALF
jgi:hypothetical protein